jgi:hypothetical protein
VIRRLRIAFDLDNPNSGWMKGISTLIEFRSKKTMPKFTLSRATSVH